MKVFKVIVDELPKDCLGSCPINFRHQMDCGRLQHRYKYGYKIGYKAPDERCKLEVAK